MVCLIISKIFYIYYAIKLLDDKILYIITIIRLKTRSFTYFKDLFNIEVLVLHSHIEQLECYLHLSGYFQRLGPLVPRTGIFTEFKVGQRRVVESFVAEDSGIDAGEGSADVGGQHLVVELNGQPVLAPVRHKLREVE